MIVFIVLSVGALVAFRWDAWFTNPEEAFYTVSDEPENIVLTFGEDVTQQRTVSWRAGDTIASACLYLTHPNLTVDTLLAEGQLVQSRSGIAAYYCVHMDSLHPGTYTYSVQTAGLCSQPRTFTIKDYSILTNTLQTDSFLLCNPAQREHFLLFGDLQYTSLDEARDFFKTAFQTVPDAEFMAYVGDIIERPTDEYWQLFFSSLDSCTLPQVAALGNHEYLKGVHKQYDVRWPHVFVNPQNGPERFCGRSYFLDFPFMRLIILDTDGLQLLSDYMIAQTWLQQVLNYQSTVMNETDVPNRRWNVVVMHHPVHSAGMGRDNWLLKILMHRTLRDADLVLAGHDHNYARHRFPNYHQLINSQEPEYTTPVYVVTSSSAKSYLPKCNNDEERLGSNHAFFSSITVSEDSINFITYMIPSESDNIPIDSISDSIISDKHICPIVYDHLLFTRTNTCVSVLEGDSLPEEIISLPARYEGRSDMKVRRFHNRLRSRKND